MQKHLQKRLVYYIKTNDCNYALGYWSTALGKASDNRKKKKKKLMIIQWHRSTWQEIFCRHCTTQPLNYLAGPLARSVQLDGTGTKEFTTQKIKQNGQEFCTFLAIIMS